MATFVITDRLAQIANKAERANRLNESDHYCFGLFGFEQRSNDHVWPEIFTILTFSINKIRKNRISDKILTGKFESIEKNEINHQVQKFRKHFLYDFLKFSDLEKKFGKFRARSHKIRVFRKLGNSQIFIRIFKSDFLIFCEFCKFFFFLKIIENPQQKFEHFKNYKFPSFSICNLQSTFWVQKLRRIFINFQNFPELF